MHFRTKSLYGIESYYSDFSSEKIPVSNGDYQQYACVWVRRSFLLLQVSMLLDSPARIYLILHENRYTEILVSLGATDVLWNHWSRYAWVSINVCLQSVTRLHCDSINLNTVINNEFVAFKPPFNLAS